MWGVRVSVRAERRTGVRTEAAPRASLVLASARAGLRRKGHARRQLADRTGAGRKVAGGRYTGLGVWGGSERGAWAESVRGCSGAREADDRASRGRGGVGRREECQLLGIVALLRRTPHRTALQPSRQQRLLLLRLLLLLLFLLPGRSTARAGPTPRREDAARTTQQ